MAAAQQANSERDTHHISRLHHIHDIPGDIESRLALAYGRLESVGALLTVGSAISHYNLEDRALKTGKHLL